MSYTVIEGRLVARTAVHIGSGKSDETTDALIRRDGLDGIVIPGTAISGALRSLANRLGPRIGAGYCAALHRNDDRRNKESCKCGVCRLFGDINPKEESGCSFASRLLVFNAKLIGKEEETTIRDGVGIDRISGTAACANVVKFDIEVLPAGCMFKLRMELRDHDPEKHEPLLAAVLAEWQAGRARLGGRTARGLGAFTLEGLECRHLDLTNRENLLAFLKSDRPHEVATPSRNWLKDRIGRILITPAQKIDRDLSPYVTHCLLIIEGSMQINGPFLANDTTVSEINGFDHAPLTMHLNDWKHPVLPGSSVRGVIRSHAERLARTLATLDVQSAEDFRAVCPACNPTESSIENPLPSCDSLLRRTVAGDREIEDSQLCLSCRLFGSPRLGSRLFVEDARYSGPDRPPMKVFDFIAIDRFTGGGLDGAKFDALALWQPVFELKIHLENPSMWELGWLALVLRDLKEQWISVGMGSAKGFGRAAASGLRMSLGFLDEKDLEALGMNLESRRVARSGLYHVIQIGLPDMRACVDSFCRKIRSFRRHEGIMPERGTTDSYFGLVDHLYPREVKYGRQSN